MLRLAPVPPRDSSGDKTTENKGNTTPSDKIWIAQGNGFYEHAYLFTHKVLRAKGYGSFQISERICYTFYFKNKLLTLITGFYIYNTVYLK